MVYFARWKVILICLAVAGGLLFSAPNILSNSMLASLPGWLPKDRISLGLDLQGGSHLLLEVDLDAVIRERLESLVDETRTKLRGERIGYTSLGVSGDRITVTIRNAEDVDGAFELLNSMATTLSFGLLAQGQQDLEILRQEGNRLTITLTEQAVQERKTNAINQSIEIVRRRIDELGTREPTIQRQGDERILIQLPGVDDPDRIKRLLGQTAKMSFHLINETVSPADLAAGRAPAGSEIMEGDTRSSQGAPERYVVRKRVVVSGENLVDASASFQQNMPVVSFRFDNVGGRRFGEATTKNVGRRLAIVLDGKVISAPVIRSPIVGGSGIISGSFTVASANDLALLLRAGALPAPLKILEERSVGPDLGADSVAAGKFAAIIGFSAVIVFIALTYGLFGMAANLSLIINLILITGVLSLLQATLTLPGIAGIVLTIGMAVDANVLIFERIREETRSGKTPIAAIEAGYKRALGTILDANITTLIAAIILFSIGSGPIKGFAVTLGIGIITSVFTAFTLTRLMIATWLRQRRPAELPL